MFPWVAAEHFVFLATLVALYSIGVMGQNILIGYTGQISFGQAGFLAIGAFAFGHLRIWGAPFLVRSEEHTSELQSRLHLVCRLLLEKKKKLTPPARAEAIPPAIAPHIIHLT